MYLKCEPQQVKERKTLLRATLENVRRVDYGVDAKVAETEPNQLLDGESFDFLK